MSLNKLVGGECGGNNTLVQLSSIVGRDGAIAHSSSHANHFVNDFLAQNAPAPQTFNMGTLLNSVQELQQNSQSSKAMWQNNASTSSMASQWSPRPMNFSYAPIHHTLPIHSPMMYHASHRPPSNVQIEYIDESELLGKSDIQEKAKMIVDSTAGDEELAYSQFMSFMKRISGGELNLADPANQERKMSRDEMLNQMEEKYKEEWAKLSDVNDYWQSNSEYGIPEEYNFTEGNIMLENKSALDLGKEKLKLGDIPGAVLCFEAAAQQQPESAEAWYLLGMTQAENEQDPLAIVALNKTLEIDPRQLEAYMTLAAAYTNENLSKKAYLALFDWLKANPKYSDILPQDVDPKQLDSSQLESHIKSLYLRAAQMDPNVDPNVQNALGVLFNITQEYDKAVDCFKTAIMVSNNDSRLWNRLGATLANSDRSEEAVQAYHEALNLEPGFIRARYNVGITCMNLGAHKQAAEHFLVALNQQNKAREMYPEASSIDNSSSTIWSTLRMVCSFMGEHDIAKLADDRNLAELNKFFNVE